MDYYSVEESLQVVFESAIKLSDAQIQRIHQISMGVLLAGSSHLSSIARWLKHTTQQDSRIQWLRRLLATDYVEQNYVYLPFVQQILTHHRAKTLHVIMDRTSLGDKKTDLLLLSVNFRNRAIPIGWEFMDHGMSGSEMQKTLIERCRAYLPPDVPVVFHGDCEFGSVDLMQYLSELGWDFIVGQSSKNYYRHSPNGQWHQLSTLPVTKQRAVYLDTIDITKRHGYGELNLFSFYKPRFSNRKRKHDIINCVTTLPITHAIRRIGSRRWGIECCFKDMKSAGWHFHLSHLRNHSRQEGLFTILSLTYLWSTCLGRWLCKTGNRSEVDAKSKRHLSLFRIGWDWLVHQYAMDLPCPTLLTLYQ